MTDSGGSTGIAKTPFWVSFIAGGISGTVGAVITCPLEVVKTRLQSSAFQLAVSNAGGPSATALCLTNPLYALQAPLKALNHIGSTVHAVRSIAVTEGPAALWKGIGATVVGVLPARALYFSTYGKGKTVIAEATGLKESDPRVHLVAAAAAGATVCTATNPIWLVKTRMQLQRSGESARYKSSLDCLKVIVREEGAKALYKGLAASYIGVAESTLQWVIYEHLKKGIANKNATQPSQDRWLEYFMAAAGAKFTAAALAYPHEVLRTRMRESSGRYTAVRQTFKTILREEGVGAFYGGMTAHLMRVVPNSAIMFFCYEFLVHSYNSLN